MHGYNAIEINMISNMITNITHNGRDGHYLRDKIANVILPPLNIKSFIFKRIITKNEILFI